MRERYSKLYSPETTVNKWETYMNKTKLQCNLIDQNKIKLQCNLTHQNKTKLPCN